MNNTKIDYNNLPQVLILATPAQIQSYISEGIRAELEKYLPFNKETTTTHAADEYITRKEVAAKLRISLNTLDTYSHEGKLKAYRIGSRILYKAHEVDAAIKALIAFNYLK